MVKVKKGAGPWLAKQKPIRILPSMPAWLVKLHSEIDWPVSYLSYLTQGGAL